MERNAVLSCRKCGKPTENTFTFYYGKKISAIALGSKAASNYAPGGSATGRLCQACIIKAAYRRILWSVVVLAACAAILAIALQQNANATDQNQTPVMLELTAYVVGVASIYTLISNIYRLATKKFHKLGTLMMIELCRGDYDSKAVDTFWTPEEYKKLHLPDEHRKQ